MESRLLTYHIAENVQAFSTLRTNGYSKGNYAAFNVTHYCGDNAEHVAKNRDLLCKELNIESHCLIIPKQVHESKVLHIDAPFLDATAEDKETALNGVDALTTDCKNVCIGVSTADCVPVLLYDTKRHVVAAIHAGWRGVVKNIIAHTLHAMNTTYGTQAKDIKAVIGPSISQNAFEVGDEVYTIFKDNGWDMSAIACQLLSPQTNTRKWHIDLWGACCTQLEQEGVLLEHIQVSGICTYNCPEHFFSARRDGIESGRIYSGILLK